MLPLLMMMDIASLRAYWRKWSWAEARMLMLGAIPGVAVGWALFGAVSADGVRLMIGLLALGFVAYNLARRFGLARRWNGRSRRGRGCSGARSRGSPASSATPAGRRRRSTCSGATSARRRSRRRAW